MGVHARGQSVFFADNAGRCANAFVKTGELDRLEARRSDGIPRVARAHGRQAIDEDHLLGAQGLEHSAGAMNRLLQFLPGIGLVEWAEHHSGGRVGARLGTIVR